MMACFGAIQSARPGRVISPRRRRRRDVWRYAFSDWRNLVEVDGMGPEPRVGAPASCQPQAGGRNAVGVHGVGGEADVQL